MTSRSQKKAPWVRHDTARSRAKCRLRPSFAPIGQGPVAKGEEPTGDTPQAPTVTALKAAGFATLGAPTRRGLRGPSPRYAFRYCAQLEASNDGGDRAPQSRMLRHPHCAVRAENLTLLPQGAHRLYVVALPTAWPGNQAERGRRSSAAQERTTLVFALLQTASRRCGRPLTVRPGPRWNAACRYRATARTLDLRDRVPSRC